MFKNIKSRRDPMEKAKQHMKVKFSNILSEKELIFNYVNELIAKVENPFVNLLGEDDRVKFLSGYHEVNQELEACLERLLIIQIILNCEQSGKNAEYSDYSNLCSIISSSDSSKKEQQCTWNQNKESNNNNNAPNGILNNRLKSVALDNIELVNADDNSSDLLLNTRLPEVTSNNVSPEITSKTTPETVSEMVANLSEQSDDSTLNTFYQNPVSSELLLTEDVSEFENRNQGDISNGYLETNNCFEYAFMDMNIANDSNNILQKSDSHNSIKSNACISTSGKFSMNSPGINNLFQDIQATDFNFLHLNSENLQNNQNGQDLKNILYSENISDKRNNCDVEDENTQLNFYSKKFLKPITDVPACDVSLNVPLPIDITYVENLRSFWLQPKKKQFEELLNHLQSAEVVKCEYTVSVGQYFLAPYVKDNNLHRVKVLKLLLENNLLVHYIDYGNEGTIPISSLRLLPSSFASIPSQAILCFLEGIPPKGLVLDIFKDLVCTKDVFAVISPPVEEQYPVKLFIKSLNENETSFEMVDITQYILNHMKNSCVSKDILVSDSTSENSKTIESACQDAEIDKLKECEYMLLSNNSSNDMSSIENSFLKDIKYEMLEFGTNFHRYWNLRVPEPDIPGDNSILIMLTSITSPSDFFANILSSRNYLLDTLEERMNKFYETCHMKYINEDKLIQPGIFCCCKDNEGKWNRAKIIKILKTEENNEEINVIVYNVDYGDKIKVSRKDILPLLPAFTKLPGFVVWCSLANIEPLRTGNNITKIWPKETIQRFFELTGFERSFNANIVSHGNAENKFPLKIIIWQTKSEANSINHILVEEGLAGLAICVGNFLKTNNVNNELEDDKEISDNWNPMADDFLSERNSYKVDIDDPGVAITGYKSNQEGYICRHFLRTGKCLWGNNCKYKHTRNEDYADDVILGNENIFSCDIDLDIPENGKYVLVQISAVFNPSHFYVIFPYGPVSLHEIISQQQQPSFNLEQLVKDMSEHYTRKKTSKDLTHEALGKIVAAKSNFDGLWYRGRIRTVNETSKQVEIFFVDFGNCEWINKNNVEDIDEIFMEFPFQALECRLANININKWKEQKHLEKEARFLFRDLTEGKVLIALILEKVNSVLYLNLYTLDGIAINEEFIKHDLFDYSPELY